MAELNTGMHVVVEMASEWADLRSASPLRGYPTLEEAVEKLTEFLG